MKTMKSAKALLDKIEKLLLERSCTDAKLLRLLQKGNCISVKPWPASEIPDRVLKLLYGIQEPVDRKVLTALEAQGKGYYWLEALRMCNHRIKHMACDGLPSVHVSERRCCLCALLRCQQLGVFLQPMSKAA